MTRAFRRSWSATVGTTRITHAGDGRELTIKFAVRKSLEREPNTLEFSIANLSPTRRRALEGASEPQIELRAGYLDLEDLIFVGDARDIWSERDGVDVWTRIEAEDGGRSYRSAVLEQGFARGTPLTTVFRAITNAMGVGVGNTLEMIGGIELDRAGTTFSEGITLSGPAWRSLDRLCRSCSLRWSVQSGALQLRQSGQPAETRAVLLAPGTGLIGSPSRGKRDDRTGRVAYSVRSLLIPGLYPGRVVSVSSSELEGNFLCRRVDFSGDSSGEDWFADLELEEYQ